MDDPTPTSTPAEGSDVDVEDAEALPHDADPYGAHEVAVDHPLEVTDEEAEDGQRFYQAVDDTDDSSNGFENGVGPVTVANPEALRRARIVKECLLRHGVPEVSIELQVGRPAVGDDWNACHPFTVISHHIASTPTPARPTPGLALVKRGRSDLPGPLANGTAGVDLVYRILTLGYANHPGTGGPWTVRGPMGAYTVPRDVARPYAWGTEFEGGFSDAVWDKRYTNKRTGKTMTFREFMGRVNAGLTEAIWLINGRGKTPKAGMDLSGYHGEHKTWAPGRKPDRRNYSTDTGRAEIRRYAGSIGRDTKGNTNEEDDVAAKDVWDHPIAVFDGTGGKDGKQPARVVVAQAHRRAGEARAQAKANAAAIAALAKAVGTHATSLVQAASDDALRAATEEQNAEGRSEAESEDSTEA